MPTSYPKNKINVLLLEGVHEHAKQMFEKEKYNVTYLKHSLGEEELCEKLTDTHILGIRSKTQITQKVIEAAPHLWVIGAFCIGTNQIDLKACSAHGVAVFNAPYSNTRSVVELALCEIIMLMRNILQKNQQTHTGAWNKSAVGNNEVRGKKLGIVGYGSIGSQLSVLAESLGMQVYYYDKVEKLSLGNVHKCSSLKALLSEVDVVTLHVDGQSANTNLISVKQLAQMKQGSYLINLSRGHVVDIPALINALDSKHLAGAAIDVYPQEPKSASERFVNELQNRENVILTPHIGGSTEEAQRNIADFIPTHAINYINTGDTYMSVNFPQLQLSSFEESHRIIHIHNNEPGVLAQINQLFAENEINIVGQYLKTNEQIGYVITDIEQSYPKELFKELKKIPFTVRFRVLY